MSEADIDMQDASDAPRARSRSVYSDAQSESGAEDRPGRTTRYNHRRKGVFDAVAGRTRVREPRPPKWPGQPIKYRHAKLAPEEALFRSAGAPPRYEETDTYFAHESLPANALPPSELVKAVHHYASHYYEVHDRVPEQQVSDGQEVKVEDGEAAEGAGVSRQAGSEHAYRRLIDERSMDETALLAFGILLEEAGRMVLGRNGALVLTEPADDGDEGRGKKDKGEGKGGEERNTEKNKEKEKERETKRSKKRRRT